jgi:hypothetical protein
MYIYICFTCVLLLLHLSWFIYTRALLVVYSSFSCGAYVSRHGVLQQRAAGEAALHEPPHVCLLMHVGAAQARTRLQERQRV